MNQEWSELNKTMQNMLKKTDTYKDGIRILFILREKLMEQLLAMKQELQIEQFSAIPFINAPGYHSKTIAYSMWHIFRIEDIVAHSLILNEKEIFYRGNYKERIKTPIITTGNELVKEQISEFSSQLDIEELYRYIIEVKESTEDLLKNLSYKDLKRKFSEEDKERLRELEVVDRGENACWLIDYWCGKDIKGLIQMPFSRHWIMHVEACNRIRNKIMKI